MGRRSGTEGKEMIGVAQTAERSARSGRRPATTAADLEHRALALFTEHGFDATTVDDIAASAGIGRRTFFRYFASKNDVVWGEFDAHLEGMRAALAASDPAEPILSVLRRAILDFNTYPPEEMVWLRRRMTLVFGTPALQAHSTLRYRSWRQVIAEYVARRAGEPETALRPQALAATLLGIALAAYEQWLARDDEDLVSILDEALGMLVDGFA